MLPCKNDVNAYFQTARERHPCRRLSDTHAPRGKHACTGDWSDSTYLQGACHSALAKDVDTLYQRVSEQSTSVQLSMETMPKLMPHCSLTRQYYVGQ